VDFQRSRRAAAEFASLNDRMLRDIGVTRADIVQSKERWLPIITS
jgi:uncharacterized protein YjiS (DUF1127 family)